MLDNMTKRLHLFALLTRFTRYGRGDPLESAVTQALRDWRLGEPTIQYLMPNEVWSEKGRFVILDIQWASWLRHRMRPRYLILNTDGSITFDRYNKVRFFKNLLTRL